VSNILDILIYETRAGGSLNVKADDLETVQGITNQVYLALFGGQVEQETLPENENLEERSDWWANNFIVEENQLNSTFERELQRVALNSAGIAKLENAARKDLEYLKAYSDIKVEGFLERPNWFRLEVTLSEPSKESTKITFIWDGTKVTQIDINPTPLRPFKNIIFESGNNLVFESSVNAIYAENN
jgi:phage gp46-like protein